MMSFRKYMEIAVNQGMDLPKIQGAGSLRKGNMVHKEEDLAHRIIPLTVHPKMVVFLDDLERRKDAPAKHRPALDVLGRVAEQPRDGGMVVVYISNMEAESLKDLASEIVSDSEKVLASKMDSSIKDDAVRWISFGNQLAAAVKNGILTVTSGALKRGSLGD